MIGDTMGLFDKVFGSKKTPKLVDEFINACMLGKIQDVDRLLKSDQNLINARDKDGVSAFTLTLLSGNMNVAEFLLKNGAGINIQAQNGITSLGTANK